jgi:hypothetical protein
LTTTCKNTDFFCCNDFKLQDKWLVMFLQSSNWTVDDDNSIWNDAHPDLPPPFSQVSLMHSQITRFMWYSTVILCCLQADNLYKISQMKLPCNFSTFSFECLCRICGWSSPVSFV